MIETLGPLLRLHLSLPNATGASGGGLPLGLNSGGGWLATHDRLMVSVLIVRLCEAADEAAAARHDAAAVAKSSRKPRERGSVTRGTSSAFSTAQEATQSLDSLTALARSKRVEAIEVRDRTPSSACRGRSERACSLLPLLFSSRLGRTSTLSARYHVRRPCFATISRRVRALSKSSRCVAPSQ